MTKLYNVFATLSADGNTAALDLSSLGTAFHIDMYFKTGVTFGSGTVKMQASPDGGTTWLDVPGGGGITSATANSLKGHYTLYGCTQIRFNLAGATTPSLDIAVQVQTIRYETVESFLLTDNGVAGPFTIRDVLDPLGWAAWGTFGSGTLTLQVSPDGGTTWFNIDSATAAALKHTSNAPEETLWRFSLAGATTPSIKIRVYA